MWRERISVEHLPKVSIIIPFYNDPYIGKAVESALAQTYPNIEIIVVDDGSDKHADLLQPYLERIHYLGKENGGTASALNHGFRLAAGKYIAWLSSDDQFYPEKIALQVAAMEQQGRLISHTGFDEMDADGQVQMAAIVPPGQNMKQFYQAFLTSNPVNGCTVMMSRQLYQHIGPFDETLPFTHDLDYWYRVILAGFPFILLPDALTAYRRHNEMGSVRHRHAVEQEIQMTRVKYESRWQTYLTELGLFTTMPRRRSAR